MLENEKEMKRMGKEINDFSKEIQKMKDDIRERTIDLEL
jgi:peptidoglycan hydrolase CwlO-like protein